MTIVAGICIAYTLFDVGLSIYIIRKIGVDEARRRVRALIEDLR